MTSDDKLHAGSSLYFCLRHPKLESPNSSKFFRHMTWFERVQCDLPERSGDDVRLFPCALPYPEVLRLETAVDEIEARQIWAMQLLNTFIAWSNFVVLGCPDGACAPQVTYRSACEARSFADRLLREAIEFASPDLVTGRLTCAGKRATVEALLEQVGSFAAAGYIDPVQVDSASSTALPVTAERVAVPERAGRVDPLEWLPEAQARVVADLEGLRKEPHLWEEICHACHRVPEGGEAELAQKLLDTDMAVLVPEHELPRDRRGKLMQGGLFCVEKNAQEDRLIFDRRPENATMPRLEWAALPSAACFARMLLEPCQYLRASGDDLRNFYYMLRLPPNWVRFNSVGRRVDSHVVEQHGLDPAVPHRLCFRVLGMGDRNGCAIAQATHEAILKSVGLLDPQETLAYGRTVPAGDLWQGVYLDDLLIASRQTLADPVPLDGTFIPPIAQASDPDMVLTKAAEAGYEKANLERALHKSFRALTQFKAWGGEIDGVKGRAGAPKEVRRQVWYLISLVVAQGWASKAVLQKINGFLAFAFQFRRELFCLQHHVYHFVSEMHATKWVRLPGFVIDELRSLSIHLVFAEWNMRRRVSSSVLATDATPTTGGAVRADAPEPLVKELWRRSEIRGAPVRLDRSDDADMTEAPIETSHFASTCGECLPWSEVARYTFRETSHINLQEARALRREVCKLASKFESGGQIQVCLNDSMVCVCAFAKGRSSSRKLNNILRGLLPCLILGDVVLALLWVETESNFADHPSRFRPLPPPRKPPGWLHSYGVFGADMFPGLEVFAGSARITAAHLKVGVRMFDPIDELWGGDAFDPRIDWLIKSRQVRWLWLAPPCSSFSPLRNLDRGGPLRPAAHPEGDDAIPEVRLGNLLWSRALELAVMIIGQDGFFIIEHPRGSKAWTLKQTQRMQRYHGCRMYPVDYGGASNPGLPNQKPTTLLTNAPWVPNVLKRCPKTHVHGPPLRGARAKAAGAYPKGFAEALADACWTWASGGAAP